MSGGATPVFLLSTERSGSNLTRSILNTHSEITAPHPLEPAYPWLKTVPPGELSEKSCRRLVRDILINKQYSFQPLVDTLDIDRVYERFLENDGHTFIDMQQALYEEYSAVDDASVWVSKDPSQWRYLDDAFEHYDDLKIVYLVRDPRDVSLSFKGSNVGRYHPYYSASRWAEEQSRGRELLENRPEDVHLLNYEQLLEESEATVRGMCEFLNIEYEPEMLYFYDTDDAQKASKSADVFENLAVPIKSDNYNKYKEQLPRNEIRIIEKLTAELLTEFGYEHEYPLDELESFELDEDSYKKEDKKLARNASIDYWQENTHEQIRRFATRSFSYYMILRYGLLQF
jgi:hypothetical protein